MSIGHVDAIVAGAGAIGLSVARALATAGREVLVIESEPVIGTGVSSRNSEVIHAGLYYPPDSLKARLCVAGREKLYRFCAERGVVHRRLGKLVVATRSSQEAKLDSIMTNALACGVRDLRRISGREAGALEPQLECVGAILSPSTGVVDSHGLMLALQGEAQAHGAQFAFNAEIDGGEITKQGVEIEVRDRGGGERFSLEARSFVNAAGLGAPKLARSIRGFPESAVPRSYLARGSYFALTGSSPFSRLVYPVPVEGGLGVHLTLDLAGRARFGPDVEWVEEIDYRVDPRRADAFYAEIRRYWPSLPDDSLTPAYAGVRPKISGPGEPAADFRIDGPRQHGVSDLVNLFGVESPGLTACLAIADMVQDMLSDRR